MTIIDSSSDLPSTDNLLSASLAAMTLDDTAPFDTDKIGLDTGADDLDIDSKVPQISWWTLYPSRNVNEIDRLFEDEE